ncbi:MAG: MTH938/NDUFAF3 family protein [Planctomycetota bacterium]|jgi:hypothetical protein
MIDKFSFGTITVDSQIYNNDIKIIKGKVVPDWWRTSGHTVDLDDVQDILQAGPDIVVIGKGDPGHMRITDTLKEYTAAHGIKLIVENTSEASKTFNHLCREGRNVAGGFHVGC